LSCPERSESETISRGRIRGEAPYVENIVRLPRRDANANILVLEGPIAGLITEIRDIAARREERAAYEFQMRFPDFRYGLNGGRFDARIVDEEEVKDDHMNEEEIIKII